MGAESSKTKNLRESAEEERITSLFNDFSERVQAQSVSEGKSVTVEVNGLTCANELATELLDQLKMRTLNSMAINVTADALAEALDALVYLRVCYVNGRRVTSIPELNPKDIKYPAFLRPVLAGIGRIEDFEESIFIDVKPSKELDRFAKYKDDDWARIADTLREVCRRGKMLGMETCPSLPHSKTGSVQVLAVFVTREQRLASAMKVTPAHLLIRSALGLSELVSVFGAARFCYNGIEYYKRQYRDFVGLSFAKC